MMCVPEPSESVLLARPKSIKIARGPGATTTLAGLMSVNQIPVSPSLVCKRRPENTPSAFDRDTKIYVFLITFNTGRGAAD